MQAESSGSVEQSLLCNFLSLRIGQAVGCWWAQHGNLTSIICLSESVLVVCRTLSSMHAFVNPNNQSGQPVSIIHHGQTGLSSYMKSTYSGPVCSHYFPYFPNSSDFPVHLLFCIQHLAPGLRDLKDCSWYQKAFGVEKVLTTPSYTI